MQNSRRAGRPKGSLNPVKPVDPDDMIEVAVDRAFAGKPVIPAAFTKLKRNRPSQNDCERLSRVLGVSIEEFNQRLAQKLAAISDKIANRIEEKIDENAFKPGELGFIFSVTEDKRRALDARAQLGSAQVNIQVNNYGDRSRDEIIADLLPLSSPPTVPISPLPPTPEPVEEIDEDNLKPEDVI